MNQKTLKSTAKALCAFAILLAVLPASAQSTSIPEPPGIYGGAPESERGAYRYVEFQGVSGDDYTVPLNGILNYVGYYIPSTGAFLPGGEYSVLYLNATKSLVGSAGSVVYSPNSGYTNGVEVSPPNPGADGPLGIQGTVDFGGSPIEGQPVSLVSGSTVIAAATTNGEGFFSLYYGTNPKTKTGFIPAGTYTLRVGTGPFCPPVPSPSDVPLVGSVSLSVTYSPTNTTNRTWPATTLQAQLQRSAQSTYPWAVAASTALCNLRNAVEAREFLRASTFGAKLLL